MHIAKWQTLIVVVAIAFSVLSPLSVHLTIEYGQASIGSFDICHSGSLGVSVNHEMPCSIENPYELIPLSSLERAENPSAVISPFSIAFLDERPPKA
jgi:hypothetical protein